MTLSRVSGSNLVTQPPAAAFSNSSTGTYTSGSTNYAYVTFTASGTLTITRAGFVDILAVAGGGSGAVGNVSGSGRGGGAGGAGGMVDTTQSGRQPIYLAAGSYTITVGAGGTASTNEPSNTAGLDSIVGTVVTAVGGGRGGAGITSSANWIYGQKGGSGGGDPTAGGPGTTNQGNSGGGGNGNSYSGGGGGAGGAGAASGGSATGTGGAGLASSIAGSTPTTTWTTGSFTFAGGGAGAGATATGGGGAGTGANGTANTGGGGGGVASGIAGNGGSGIVIVRVRTN